MIWIIINVTNPIDSIRTGLKTGFPTKAKIIVAIASAKTAKPTIMCGVGLMKSYVRSPPSTS